MTTFRLIVPFTLLCMVTLASAEPARPRQGNATTPPPAASTTRGPNQPAVKAPANQAGTVAAPQTGPQAPARPGTPTAGSPNQPTGKAPVTRGGVWGTPARGQTAPVAKAPAPPALAPKAPAAKAPAPPALAPKAPTPQAPAPPARPNDRPQPNHGYTPAPPASHGPAQPVHRAEWDQRDNRGGPDHGSYRPMPQPPARRPVDWDKPYHGRHEGHWKYAPLVGMIVRAFLPSNPRVLGAVIVADKDTFLGVISRDEDDPDSITNPYGRFGSPWSPHSLWNLEGRWGSRYASDSPWNPHATRPPRVYDGNQFRGYLTVNTSLYPRIDPEWLRSYLDLPRW